MTPEEKLQICKMLRRETACGMQEANVALLKLISALKNRPLPVMDSPWYLKITWEKNDI